VKQEFALRTEKLEREIAIKALKDMGGLPESHSGDGFFSSLFSGGKQDSNFVMKRTVTGWHVTVGATEMTYKLADLMRAPDCPKLYAELYDLCASIFPELLFLLER
jgi:hypothetical protein